MNLYFVCSCVALHTRTNGAAAGIYGRLHAQLRAAGPECTDTPAISVTAKGVVFTSLINPE